MSNFNSVWNRAGSPLETVMQTCMEGVGLNPEAPDLSHAGAIREAVDRFTKVCLERMNPKNKDRYKPAERWSLKELLFCTVPGVHENMEAYEITQAMNRMEAIGASAFPTLTSALLNPKMIEAYEYDLDNADQLVTDWGDFKQADEIIPGVTAGLELSAVGEMELYPSEDAREKYVKCLTRKFGKIVGVTWEMVRFDQTGQIIRQVSDVGTKMGAARHQWILQKLQDVACTMTGEAASTALRYKGTGAAVYSDDHSAIDGQTNDNLNATSAFSYVKLNAAINLLMLMKDEKGTPIANRPDTVVIPVELEQVVLQAIHSSGQYDTTDRADNTITRRMRGINVFPTPYCSTQSSTTWYCGSPKKQLIWGWTRRPSVVSIGASSESSLKQDIIQMIRASAGGGCAARDYRHMVKSTA